MQFELYDPNLVDIRKENDIPPADNKQYTYQPVPAETVPPIGKNHLMHMFHHPEDGEGKSVCFNRFPKKKRYQLQVLNGSQTQPGWGINFVEGIYWQKIFAIGMVICLLSLVFGIAWAVKRDDVQGGFGVAAYVLTFLSCLVGFLGAMGH